VLKGVSGDFSLTGKLELYAYSHIHEKAIGSLVVEDNISGYQLKTYKLEIETYASSRRENPTYYSETTRGRIYSNDIGYVDIETPHAFFHVDPSHLYAPIPDHRGLMVLTGENGATIDVVFVPPERIQVNVDVDSDGEPDYRNVIPLDGVSTTPAPPVPEIQNPYAGEIIASPSVIQLDAGNSFDANGELLTYRWKILSEPEPGAGVLSSTSSPQIEFRGAVGGIYEVQLTVSDGVTSESSTVQIETLDEVPGPASLAHQVIDAKYSRSLDRIVMISEKSNVLYLYDPATNQEQSIELPLKPKSVSLGPDGDFAAVIHDGYVSYIDLVNRQLLEVFSVATQGLGTVLGSNGYIYTLGGAAVIRAIDIGTGEETSSYWGSTNSTIKLHPNNEWLYSTNSSGAIDRFLIAGAAVISDHSTYSRDTNSDACGDLWLFDTGEKLVSACGDVFDLSEAQGDDLIKSDVLSISGGISHMDHSSNAHQLAVITETNHSFILLDDQNFSQNKIIKLPTYIANKKLYARSAEYIFFNDDGSELYVVTQLAGTPTITDRYEIITYNASTGEVLDKGFSSNNSTPVATIKMDQVLEIGEPVILNGTESNDKDFDVLSYSWVFESIPQGSLATISDNTLPTAEFTPDVRGTYQVKLVVSDLSDEGTDTRRVEVSSAVDLLDYEIIDAKYSDALNRIIMISTSPDTLHIYDPESTLEQTIPLPHEPLRISISPDGKFAAVAHLHNVSYIDLEQVQLDNTFDVSMRLHNVLEAGNGFVYLFPESREELRSIEIATGIETVNLNLSVEGRLNVELHLDNISIYTMRASLKKYSIIDWRVEYEAPKPPAFFTNVNLCRRIWLSERADKIFSGCGRMVNPEKDPDRKPVYSGSLSMSPIVTGLANSAETNRTISFYGNNNQLIRIYNGDYLEYEQGIYPPNTYVPDEPSTSTGRYVFFNSDGNRFYLILSPDFNREVFGVAAYGSD